MEIDCAARLMMTEQEKKDGGFSPNIFTTALAGEHPVPSVLSMREQVMTLLRSTDSGLFRYVYSECLPDEGAFSLRIPRVYVCYGHRQLAFNHNRGRDADDLAVAQLLFILNSSLRLFAPEPAGTRVWMSQADDSGASDLEMVRRARRAYAESPAAVEYELQLHPITFALDERIEYVSTAGAVVESEQHFARHLEDLAACEARFRSFHRFLRAVPLAMNNADILTTYWDGMTALECAEDDCLEHIEVLVGAVGADAEFIPQIHDLDRHDIGHFARCAGPRDDPRPTCADHSTMLVPVSVPPLAPITAPWRRCAGLRIYELGVPGLGDMIGVTGVPMTCLRECAAGQPFCDEHIPLAWTQWPAGLPHMPTAAALAWQGRLDVSVNAQNMLQL